MQELKKLRDLTANLPSFPETHSKGPGFKRHQMECGNSLSWDLDPHTKEKAGVAKWFNSTGTIFPEHVHESREWVIVLEGSMFLRISGSKPERLLAGQSKIIEPNTPHSAEFLEDCWYYAITIPRDKNWPE